jgi:Ca2+-binding RTX toxin-like protein
MIGRSIGFLLFRTREMHMTTHTITGYRDTPWLIKGHDATFTLAEKSTIHVWDNFGIGVQSPHTGNTLDILGDVLTNSGEGVAIGIEADGTTVNVGGKARVVGNQAISSDAVSTHVTNNGLIHGFEDGATLATKAHLVNHGDIFGSTAVELDSGTVENGKGAHLFGDDAAILFAGHGNHDVVNHGLISAGLTAIDLGHAGGHIVNGGRIDGIVDLGAGDATFDTRKGFLHGQVGGMGDDTYRISAADINIVEQPGGGFDRIYSTVTVTMPDNTESLQLLGTADVDGHGNDTGVNLTGNAGKNHLTGGAGGDNLTGGAGHDILEGGAGNDNFDFFRGDGKDTILDYVDGEDKISILGFDHVKSFAQLESHIHQQDNGDVWITFAGDDKLVLKHTDATVLDSGDFFYLLS